MRIELNSIRDEPVREIDGFRFLSWDSSLLENHAEAKYRSFCNELDSHVFPCLGKMEGCVKLMNEISCRSGFIPEATWLVCYGTDFHSSSDNCGTVQGIREGNKVGSIQNLGIVPEHRGSGVGSELLRRSLIGFKQVGIESVSLEVTAQNRSALKLYERTGFEVVEVVYKHADLAY